MLQSIQSDEKRGLYCVDWQKLGQELEIWGVSQYNDFKFIDLTITPCQYVHKDGGITGDSVTPECLWDQQAQMDYIGNLRALVYIAEQTFDINEYGEKSIEKRSRFYQ